jgi:uncharacterized membrane protein
MIDPARVICFGLAIWLRPELDTFAAVFLLFFCASVPVSYWLKDKVQPTVYRAMARALWPSAHAALPPLIVAIVFAHWMRADGPLVPLPFFLCFVPAYLALWLGALLWARHPVADEPPVRALLLRLHVSRDLTR